MANSDNKAPQSQEGTTAPASAPAVQASNRGKAYLLTLGVTVLVVWAVGAYAIIYFTPRLLYNRLENTVVSQGLGGSNPASMPINTLYTLPTLASLAQASSLESTGNRDTLYTLGWLDLSKEPEVLHVPDMAGRYYNVQLMDPWGTDFATVGRRTTGTRAGDYLISGPGWHGTAPAGMTQMLAPDNTVLLIGRTLVKSESDLATAYALAKQIQVTPLSQWHPGH